MIILLAVLCSLILITLGVIAVFCILTYNRLSKITMFSNAAQSYELATAAATQKSKKPPLAAVKQILRGRSITNTEELVDIDSLPIDDAIKAIEEAGQ